MLRADAVVSHCHCTMPVRRDLLGSIGGLRWEQGAEFEAVAECKTDRQ